MKRSILLFTGFVFLLLLGLVTISLTWSNPPGQNSLSSSTQVPPDYPAVKGEDMENIPLYAGAQQVKQVVYAEPDLGHETQFVISDPYEKVLAFYREILPKKGWIMLKDGTWPIYEWSDKDGVVPWGLNLTIAMQILSGGETQVELKVFRWPDVSKTPLYPGAQQVEETFVPSPPSKDQVVPSVRTTIYTTTATPVEVESYYRSKLGEEGWRFLEEQERPADLRLGIVFSTTYKRIGSLSIIAEPQPTGQSRVEMRYEEFNTSLTDAISPP